MRRGLVALALASGLIFAAGDAYRAEIEHWRQQREAALKADGGWLTVTGLFWLHEGANSFGVGPQHDIDLPPDPAVKAGGTVELHHGTVIVRSQGQVQELRPDSSGKLDRVTLGSLSLFLIHRGNRYGIRLKDTNSRLRKEFTGLHYFPIDASYRITTRLIPSPRQLPIPNIIGQVQDVPSPGYVEFQLHGQTLRLWPIEEAPGELSFIFRDKTTGKETYGSGRFLDTQLGNDGMVVLDFNKAYNPPCAFTPYATCPLPPKENRLTMRIEAGELKYGSH